MTTALARFVSRAVDAVAAGDLDAADLAPVVADLWGVPAGMELLLLEAAEAHLVATGQVAPEPLTGPPTALAAAVRRSYYVGLICGASYVPAAADAPAVIEQVAA